MVLLTIVVVVFIVICVAKFSAKTGETVDATADLIVGGDGAYSALRKQYMKQPRFNYAQEYIPHAYLELCIPPNNKGGFAMDERHLHIWPRGSFMMIALPNQDFSWTVTLFMPFDVFEQLTTPEQLLEFFNIHYADAVTLIGKDRLIKDFFLNKPLPLISVKCTPFHAGKSVIMGDAAHAVVPFYGQGMNAGMEDVLIFDEFMDQYGDMNLDKVLPAFSDYRCVDAHAVVDLAMYNYIEMRDLVNHWTFALRKKFDDAMYWLRPNGWVPLYTSVTFSRMRYHLCIENKKWQDRVVRKLVWSSGVVVAATLTAVAFNYRKFNFALKF